MAVLCNYCNEVSEDNNVCSKCGKKIRREIGRWTIKNDNKIWIDTLLTTEDISNCDSENIESPLCIKDGKACFNYENETTLIEYLRTHGFKFSTINPAIVRIGEIIESVNSKKKILGSLDLEQLWVRDDDIKTLHLKQTRRYLKRKDQLNGYKCGRISPPEILFGNSSNINYSSDVYILGKVFLMLVINEVAIENVAHESFLAYFINAFNDELPMGIHEWMSKTISAFSEERYKKPYEALRKFMGICKSELHEFNEIRYEYIGATDPGDFKRLKVKELDEEHRNKANEDAYLISEDKEACKLFAMVADGISNADYGTGYEAANIVKDNCIKSWSEKEADLQTLEDVKSFFIEIINNSNNEINKSINKQDDSDLSGTVMGSTFAAVVILKNKMYFVSLGDSKIYLFSNDRGLNLLNYEENYGTELLKNGYSWSECSNIDGFSSLTNCIGGNDIKDGPRIIEDGDLNVKEISLRNKDVILICSDGVTDYISPLGYSNNLWNIDKQLKSYLTVNGAVDDTLDIPSNLIQAANENGGGDNITSVMIKVFLI